MKAFSITGWSGSGKTTLIARLIEYFNAQGKRVAAVKHAPHKYYLEPEATDTFKYLAAGSEEVCLVSKHQMLTMKRINEMEPADIVAMLESRYSDCDFLLLEGLRKPGIPIIEIFDAGENDHLKNPLETLSAVVSDNPDQWLDTEIPTPCFRRDEIEKIAHFIEAYGG